MVRATVASTFVSIIVLVLSGCSMMAMQVVDEVQDAIADGDEERVEESDDSEASGGTDPEEAEAGDVLWRFETGGRIATDPVLGDDGTIYFGSNDGNLYAVDSEGNERWRHHFGDDTRNRFKNGLTLGPDGTIYGADRFSVYAFDPNGEELWSTELDVRTRIRTGPALSADGILYITGAADVIALDAETGELLWQEHSAGRAVTTPVVGEDGTMYFGIRYSGVRDADYIFLAVDPSTGEEIWHYKIEGDHRYDSYGDTAIDENGILYFPGYDGHLHAVDPEEGEKLWRSDLSGQVSGKPAIGDDGTIYIGADEAGLIAIDPRNPEEPLWRFETDGQADVTPAIGAEGSVFVTTHGDVTTDAYIFGIAPDGSEQWRVDARSFESSPIISDEGILYAGTSGGELFAISTGGEGPADDIWPVGGGDRRRSGARFHSQ